MKRRSVRGEKITLINIESKATKSQDLSEFESIRIAAHVCGDASMG